jgi:hypothetical protein
MASGNGSGCGLSATGIQPSAKIKKKYVLRLVPIQKFKISG